MSVATDVVLGRLRQIEIRSVWPGEAAHFTPWLADNLDALGDALGLNLVLEGVEEAVGPFRADILAREDQGDEDALILIENQFGITDHDHAGKLLTYAAGLKARTVIWIAESFRDEHRAAIDYLNEITRDEYAFFAVTVQAMRIGDHPPVAPHFTVFARPNNWSKRVASAQKNSSATNNPREAILKSYWTKLLLLGSDRFPRWKNISPTKYSNQRIESILGGDPSVTLYASFSNSGLRIEIYIDGELAKKAYEKLLSKRDNIEKIYDMSLVWEPLEGGRASRISALLPAAHYNNSDDWDRQHEWIIANFEKARLTFQPLMADLSSISTQAPDLSADFDLG